MEKELKDKSVALHYALVSNRMGVNASFASP